MQLSIQRIPPDAVRHGDRACVERALNFWGDAEMFTDGDVRVLRRHFRRWFGQRFKGYRVRIWRDAIVMCHANLPEVEYSVSAQSELVLYVVHRPGSIAPGSHASMSYLGHVVDLAMTHETPTAC